MPWCGRCRTALRRSTGELQVVGAAGQQRSSGAVLQDSPEAVYSEGVAAPALG
jgi:hypothetical protein